MKKQNSRAEGAKPERLQKILSAHGIASRRAAEKILQEGRVCVNGIQSTLGQSATVGIDVITVDGVPLETDNEHIYLMLNKPRGYLTTVRDERGRNTVMDLIKDVGSRVYPVGRLDLDSEGLLLFTNNGAFANSIMHPSFNKQKTYEVEVIGDARRALELLKKSVVIDDHTVLALSVELPRVTDEISILLISISEGKKRQIRKMCSVCGVKVISLKRISIGPLNLGDLKTGHWRFLTKEEVSALG